MTTVWYVVGFLEIDLFYTCTFGPKGTMHLLRFEQKCPQAWAESSQDDIKLLNDTRLHNAIYMFLSLQYMFQQKCLHCQLQNF